MVLFGSAGAVDVCLTALFALHGAVAVRVSVLMLRIVLGVFGAAYGAFPTIYFSFTFWTFHKFFVCLNYYFIDS